MQWAKVKNVLIVILLAVNLFLLGNLSVKLWQDRERAEELETSLRTLAGGYGLALDEAFRLPENRVLPALSIDRSRADEEAVAAAILGQEMERTEQEDGTVVFESERGVVEWRADGSVSGRFAIDADPPQDEADAARLARSLFAKWGFAAENETLAGDGMTVTLTGTVAGLPVFNRAVSLRFEENGEAVLSGLWSFGTPYTTVRGGDVSCSAADALLEFAAGQPEADVILSMTAGYRMQTDSSRRLQFTPTWKIETNSGGYLVDCDKKTVVDQEN